MKKLIGLFIIAVMISAGMASYSYAASDMAALPAHTVNGDLLQIDKEFYVVKDMLGKETRLHVDKTTILDGSINVGEKVEVRATDKNHALSIRHVLPNK